MLILIKAICLESIGNYKEALETCDKIIALDPLYNIKIYKGKSMILRALGQDKEAKECTNIIRDIEEGTFCTNKDIQEAKELTGLNSDNKSYTD